MPEHQIFNDTMTLGQGHSILLGNAPKNLDTKGISDKFFEMTAPTKDTIAKFGLFGGDLNYHTFYPDATPEHFNPKEDEFIEPVYRLLSNCIVSKNYMPTEFPAKVLKDSMKLLVGQTVNCDHEDGVGNAIGSVKEVYWQEAYTHEGVSIPAGINGKLKIDAMSNPRIARGINMDPPSIHSNSVTVQFEWKPSHQYEKIWEFYDNLGKIHEDGTMVRRIATRIVAYRETSLVSHGADPFAQKLDKDGKIVNPKYSNQVYYSFSDKGKWEEVDPNKVKIYGYDDYKEITLSSYSEHETGKNNNIGLQTNQSNNMDELQKFLDQLFGEGMLSAGEQAPNTELVLSQVKTLISEKISLAEAKTQLEGEITSLKDQVAHLQADLEKYKSMANIGESHLKDVRNSTLESYKKLNGEEVDANIIALIEAESTSLDTLASLKSSYDKQLDEKFPLHCAKCHSTDINRGSAIAEGNDGEGQQSLEEKSVREVLGDIAKNKLK